MSCTSVYPLDEVLFHQKTWLSYSLKCTLKEKLDCNNGLDDKMGWCGCLIMCKDWGETIKDKHTAVLSCTSFNSERMIIAQQRETAALFSVLLKRLLPKQSMANIIHLPDLQVWQRWKQHLECSHQCILLSMKINFTSQLLWHRPYSFCMSNTMFNKWLFLCRADLH